MNTGGQCSSATPYRASTTTVPAGKSSLGKPQVKKNLPEIIAAHGAPYVATASVAYLKDLRRKVKKAMTYSGSRYIEINTPCPSVWSFPSHLTLEVGRMGVNCGLVPLFEMENGCLTNVRRIKKPVPVEGYLTLQKRFRHLFENDQGKAEIQRIQKIADRNLEKYGLRAEEA
jgi:pyruvate ferredoxin oxidoreductase beta subunit